MPKTDQKFYLNIAISVPVNSLFDYLPESNTIASDYELGMRLSVPFGKAQKTGVLISISEQSEFSDKRLKPIIKRLDQPSLLNKLDLKLMQWAADYYHHPMGDVFAHAFPKQLRRGEPAVELFPETFQLSEHGLSLTAEHFKRSPRQATVWSRLHYAAIPVPLETFDDIDWDWKAPMKRLIEKGIVETQRRMPRISHTPSQPDYNANSAQQAAIDSVLQTPDTFQAFLLDGVTGSGKTEVYLQLMQQMLDQDKQVLVLLPEITLTPQLAARFRDRLAAHMVVFHSGLSDSQRTQAWLRFKNGHAQIMLGTRSAVFTPADRLGLIIMDEEHDSSFKQQEGFRYSARDVATMRARNLGIPILLGSATPSLESLNNVRQQRFKHLSLPERTAGASHPDIRLMDCRNAKLDNHLSEPLKKAISRCIDKDEQVIIFVNRRGFAPVLMCRSCGWVAQCRRCDTRLVIHQKQRRLKCHHCGADHSLPKVCPDCHEDQLFPLGLGTERVEQTLSQLYPNVPVTRIDRDSTRKKDAMQTAIDHIHKGGAHILIGTQMLAKGHHFPNVTLVGIIDIDAGLFSCDFRASEKMAQLIVQVAGRAGREEKIGRVLIQTHHPEHPLLNTLIHSGYARFAQDALDERHEALLPPYQYQALLRVNAIDEAAVLEFLDQAQQCIQQIPRNGIDLYGPVPAPMLKRAGRYRYQLLIQSANRKQRYQFLAQCLPMFEKLKSARKVRWSIDVDPQDLY